MMGTNIKSLAELDEKLWRSGCLLFLVLVFAVISLCLWVVTVEVRLDWLEEKVGTNPSVEVTR